MKPRSIVLLLLAMTALPVASSLGADAPRADRQQEAANKKIVLDMWHQVINGRDLAKASKYIAENYVQHSPSAGQGRAAVVEFLKKELGGDTPRAPGTFQLTQFEHVIAEGDLVQLMFRRKVPHPKEPGKMIDVWWYDTYRVQGGMIVEHWDSALE